MYGQFTVTVLGVHSLSCELQTWIKQHINAPSSSFTLKRMLHSVTCTAMLQTFSRHI